MQKIKFKKKHYLIIFLILFFYFVLTICQLIKLPVFADEAIYIRWTQLIIDDWQRYLFFPMNDGKTPLQMWLMLPLQFFFKNQLFAGRFLSVLVGAGNILILGLIAREINQEKKHQQLSQYLAMLLGAILPFTFFHHRMALTDTLLFLNLSLSFFLALKYINKEKIYYLLLLIILFFLALFSKLSALLFIPSLLILLFLQKKLSFSKLLKKALFLSSALAMAFFLFYLLRFIPVFPQLFSRGGDFLYPLSTLWSDELFSILLRNAQMFNEQLLIYLGPAILFLSLPLFNKKNIRPQIVLLAAFLTFVLPLALLGKIVYPRYLLPASLYLIVSASLSLSHLLKHKQSAYQLLGVLLIVLISIQSAKFIFNSYFDIDQIPFSRSDRIQYLEEWSSGQGIFEATKLMQEESLNQRIAVATEGYFGTLPDGILMFLHRRNVDNLMIEGIGQPISSIPDSFLNRAKDWDQLWLIVNSHRLKIEIDENNLIREYCRPNNAPCLQVWNITYLLNNN